LALTIYHIQSNNSLGYVKLARTKGALLLRAVETRKRTYLAVLCGEAGERVELFTVSAPQISPRARQLTHTLTCRDHEVSRFP
jgi:hypothetical protein